MLNTLKEIGIELTQQQNEQYEKYYELLVEWNKVMNLTGITEHDEVLLKHYIDSLWVYTVPEFSKQLESNPSLIDVGTGAGFPGVPLKIAFPMIKVTLLDSLNKRINFLNEVISSNKLENIVTIHGRAEDSAQNKELRENFDICVSRAVANLSTLSEYCLPFVKMGGIFISYKSGNIDEEIEESKKAVEILGGEIVNVYKSKLPNSDIERSFVVIKKIKNTPKKYPRKAGLPSKEPIK